MLVPIEAMHPPPTRMHGDTYESEVGFQIFDPAGKITLATANLGDAATAQRRCPGFCGCVA